MAILSLLLGHFKTGNTPFYLYQTKDDSILLYKLVDICALWNIDYDNCVSSFLENNSTSITPSITFYRDKNQQSSNNTADVYITTLDLAQIAIKQNKFSLAELCKLNPTDYAAHLADGLLSKRPLLNYLKNNNGSDEKEESEEKEGEEQQEQGQKKKEKSKKKKDTVGLFQFQETNLELVEIINDKMVKPEPVSPPSLSSVSHSSRVSHDPMAIDTMISHGAGSRHQQLQSPLLPRPQQRPQQQTRRLSSSILQLDELPNKKQKTSSNTSTPTLLPKPVHTVGSQQQQQQQASSLLTKRIQQSGKNARNLTIFAPSHGESYSTGIRSAPLNSNFPHASARQAHHQQPLHTSKNIYSNAKQLYHQPHPLSKAMNQSSPLDSTTSSEFAIPPIVPSQQQAPHTAHPSSLHHFPPHSPQYPSTAFGHSFPVTSGRVSAMDHHSQQRRPHTAAPVPIVTPKSPPSSSSNYNNHNNSSGNGLQQQQFMQPFEHLFDTIETTRTLKSTLDDQIRRSSALIQTLQASFTTIEGLVRNQIKEAQKDVMIKMEDSVDNLFKRIRVLERRHGEGRSIRDESEEIAVVNPASGPMPRSSSSSNSSITSSSNSSERQQHHQKLQQQKRDLIIPPTVVKSQNDIGPGEYHSMLETLRERLDKLERQLET